MQKKRIDRVLIVGCGNLGGYFADRLKKRAEITCVDAKAPVRRKEQRFLQGCSFDLLICAVKCPDMLAALKMVKPYCKAQRVLFLQNGDFRMAPLQRLFPKVAMVRGVTTSAVGKDTQGRRRLFYEGVAYLGSVDCSLAQAQWVASFLRGGGIKARVINDYRSAVWAKLIFSAVMNPFPIATSRGYDSLSQDDALYTLVKQGLSEGRRVAKALGIRLAFTSDGIIRELRSGRSSALCYQGSMVQDVRSGRRSEIEFITGVVVREAKRLKISTPVLTTFYQAVKERERTRGRSR